MSKRKLKGAKQTKGKKSPTEDPKGLAAEDKLDAAADHEVEKSLQDYVEIAGDKPREAPA